MTTQSLVELRVGHSLPALDFAPFFVADALGHFRDEGLSVSTFFDLDRQRPIQMLLGGQLDCLLTGPLRTFDFQNRGVRPPAPSIVVINHRCPFYLVGRTIESLGLEDLVGKRIILYGGSPPPNLLLKHVVRMAGVDLRSIEWMEGIAGEAQIKALENGRGDYAMLSQPETERLISEGRGHIVLSMVDLLGPLHFSTVVAPRRFVEERPTAARALVRGIQRAKDWMAAQPPSAIADTLAPRVPDLGRGLLERVLRRAQAEQYWVGRPSMARWHYEWLKEAYCTESQFFKPVPFSEGVDNRFADEVEAEYRGRA